jgi:hypothetical protein
MDNAEQIVDAAIRRLRPQEKANSVVNVVSVVPEPEWPKMDGAAYQGLAGEIVEAISPHTESDPVAILLQVLTFFGNAIGAMPTTESKIVSTVATCLLFSLAIAQRPVREHHCHE